MIFLLNKLNRWNKTEAQMLDWLYLSHNAKHSVEFLRKYFITWRNNFKGDDVHKTLCVSWRNLKVFKPN